MWRLFIVVLCMLSATTTAHAQSTAQKTVQKPAAATSDKADPKAMRHMVKAPAVNIAALRDPFASYLSLMAQRNEQILAAHRAKLSSRPHEELENFDLSTLQLVATMRMGNRHVAMVQDSTGKGYMVQIGNYMGKNNGRVVKITNDSVVLNEQVVDPAGDLVNRKVTLTLKEVNQ